MFNLAAQMASGLAREFLLNASKPVNFSVIGDFKSGKSVFKDSALAHFFEKPFSLWNKDVERRGNKKIDEYWSGDTPDGPMEIHFTNFAFARQSSWVMLYNQGPPYCYGGIQPEDPHVNTPREAGGINFVQNCYPEKNGAFDINLEVRNIGKTQKQGLLAYLFQRQTWDKEITITAEDTSDNPEVFKSPQFQEALQSIQANPRYEVLEVKHF